MWVKALGAAFRGIKIFRYQRFTNLGFFIIPSIVTLFGTCFNISPTTLQPIKDFLLEKLSRNYDVTRIKSIGGCAQVRFTSSPSLLFVGNPTSLVSSFVACHRLVEINPDPFIPRVGPATSASLSTTSKHVLVGQHPRRTRYIRPYPCISPRSTSRGSRYHGRPRRNLCQRVDPCGSAPSRPGVLDVGRVGTYGQNTTREHVPRKYGRRRMGEHWRGRGLCDWYVGAWQSSRQSTPGTLG